MGDASRLFLTVADFVLNRPPESALPIYPLAHVFSENWSHDQQYLKASVPSPRPAAMLPTKEGEDAAPVLSLVPGDFVKAYSHGGPRHRQFDAIVTCFFIDTVTDPVELFELLDSLLVDGGVWINVGPLNWRKEARMKLNFEEIRAMWVGLGYE